MWYFLYALLFIIFRAGTAVILGDAEGERFLRDCPPVSRCGTFDIRFPLSLDSSPSYCSPPGMRLSCANNNTLLLLSLSTEVTNIVYIKYTSYNNVSYIHFHSMTIKFKDSCPLRELVSVDLTFLTTAPFDIPGDAIVRLNCSTKITWTNETEIAGPISCLSDEHHFVYVAPARMQMVEAPSGCYGVPSKTGGMIPHLYDDTGSWEQQVQNFTRMQLVDLYLHSDDMLDASHACNNEGIPFIYSHSKNKVYCRNPQGYLVNFLLCLFAGSLIAGPSLAGGTLLFALVSGILFKLRKLYKEEKALREVEKFLENYWSMKPTRYTYAEIIKIAKRFKHKLGEGGFGSVYKGELPNGFPVAIKLLGKFVREGEDFINEVSTIGTLHHFNIVCLLGFCAEGSRRALIYEFMPSESLEKHIFSREVNGQKPLSMEKIQDIALGIARGIEYLHQGCTQWILHFDIKPRNILLDYNFKPKIADFGLAKLCSKDQSIVSMTAMRGTMGYIAPEMYSRNFGTISYKSDVYSFGMLLLEMTGRRKNLDPNVKNQSQIYFPEWVYDRLVHDDQVHKIPFKVNKKDEAIMKKLVIVGLWCIQPFVSSFELV